MKIERIYRRHILSPYADCVRPRAPYFYFWRLKKGWFLTLGIPRSCSFNEEYEDEKPYLIAVKFGYQPYWGVFNFCVTIFNRKISHSFFYDRTKYLNVWASLNPRHPAQWPE